MNAFTKIAVLAPLCAISSVITFGAMTAQFDYECHHEFSTICNAGMVEGDQAFAVTFAGVPVVGWLAGIIVTGGYRHGFKFSETPTK